jgi:hypothetical protein
MARRIRVKKLRELREGERYELTFEEAMGCGYSFPCDAEGNVKLDDLDDKAQLNYIEAISHTYKFRRIYLTIVGG